MALIQAIGLAVIVTIPALTIARLLLELILKLMSRSLSSASDVESSYEQIVVASSITGRTAPLSWPD